jgi:phenylpropionate dioxygenase-like ring-hydroxylating dioxygenase large terminal subunit
VTSCRELVHASSGTVDRRIFGDEDLYRLELERIFARAWNFMCHESQLPRPGDFFSTWIGEDRVIVTRDRNGQFQVLLNTCRHRGNAVCRADQGHATSFVCTYHGWTYDLQGKLIGVPGLKEFYHGELDRDAWGLVRAAQVDSYLGYVFATFDPDAPALHDYLGEVGRLAIGLQASRGRMAILDGIQKYTIGCNWKLAVDNLWDWYHTQVTHASAAMSGYIDRLIGPAAARAARSGERPPHNVLFGEYGHAISGPMFDRAHPERNIDRDSSWRERAEVRELLGPVGVDTAGHANIFPNLWLTTNQMSLRIPKGPGATEIWWFTLLDQDLPREAREEERYRANHNFGPAGLQEQDDGENWAQCTRGARGAVARRYPLHYAMNLGRGEIRQEASGPPRIITTVNEHAQLWHYRCWAEWMDAASWPALAAERSATPTGAV